MEVQPTIVSPDENGPLNHGVVSVMLIAMNVIGIFLAYLSSILLARNLSLVDFERYIGAVATLGLMASLSEAGFGKYALRAIPNFLATERWSLVRGYVRFAIAGTLVMSLTVGFAVSILELGVQSGEDKTLMIVSIAMLPTIAIAGVVIDLMLAFRLAAMGTFISRVLIPLSTLAMVWWGIRHPTITAYDAVAFFAGGSWFALLAALVDCLVRRRRFSDIASTERNVEIHWRDWIAASFSFMAFYFLIAWLSRATLFIVSHLHHESDQLAILGAAMESGCLIALVSKSTDKYFLPNIAMHLDTDGWQQIKKIRRVRFVVVGCGAILFVAAIMHYGRDLLSLFGANFVSGYRALCLIAIGSSIWTVFSLAPSILLYLDQRRLLLRILSVHGIMLTVLTCVLFPAFGAIGAAAAYAISVSSFSVITSLLATRSLRAASAI